MNPGTLPLLIEIGCEEIPARLLAGAHKDFGERLQQALREAGLLAGAVREAPLQTYATPRRLVAHVPEVLEKQPDRVEEVRGPTVKAAFDAQGNPTRAAESFAAKNGAAVRDLIKVPTPKGEYIAVEKRLPGRSALEVLPEILPRVIIGLDFPKSMYWERSRMRFIRPIRWLLAILGGGERARVIPFEVAAVRSANLTYGHRMSTPGPVTVTSFGDYSRKLRQMNVEFDPETRRQSVLAEFNVLLEDWMEAVQDKELEEWIVNSTEWPSGIRGTFDDRFLHLPREILVTVMGDHQKYFAVQDTEGNLLPHFVAVLNRDRDATGSIRAGHERVLAARFSDAEFFWNADQKVPLRDRVPMLERVTYQAKLGSYADKMTRMQLISDDVAKPPVFPAENVGHLRGAIMLSKCDLTTQMVQEFPELQGVVGGLYARAQGEPEEVWRAIYDHYLPRGFDDDCPKTKTGALVSFVDKFDAVLAGFAAGLEPRGSNDPFGLRRHASGVIKLTLEFGLPINVRELIHNTYSRLEMGNRRPGNEVYDALVDFLGDRLRYYLETIAGIRFDTVRAVMEVGFDVPLEALRRAQALEQMRGSGDFLAVCAAAKRIRNILAKSASGSDWQPGEPAEEWLQEEPEKELYRQYRRVIEFNLRDEDPTRYAKFLRMIASLRPAVDRFFDKVLVMDEDRNLRQNRLRLLAALNERFSVFADLSQIESITSGFVGASTS